MRLRWEQPRQGLCRGFTPEGHELAQVARVHSPAGDDLGWIVWFVHDQGKQLDHYPTAEAAQAAAERALSVTQLALDFGQ